MYVDKEDILSGVQTVLGNFREEVESWSEFQLFYERVRRGGILRIPGKKEPWKKVLLEEEEL